MLSAPCHSKNKVYQSTFKVGGLTLQAFRTNFPLFFIPTAFNFPKALTVDPIYVLSSEVIVSPPRPAMEVWQEFKRTHSKFFDLKCVEMFAR